MNKKDILHRIKETNDNNKGNSNLGIFYLGTLLLVIIVGTIYALFAV